MKKEELIKSLVDKNPDLLKNAEALIKEYPEECKGLTPEELVFRTNRLGAWTQFTPEALSDRGEEALSKRYPIIYPLYKCWEAIDAKLQNPELEVSEKFPEELKSLQLIDDKGKLKLKSPQIIIGNVFEQATGETVWQKCAKAIRKIRKSKASELEPKVVESKVNTQAVNQPLNLQIFKDLIDQTKGKNK